MSTPRNHPVFSRSDEAFHERLASDTPYSGRNLFRIRRARPFLATGRIRDILNREWIVPSTHTDGREYHTCLDTGECFETDTGEQCPDKTYNRKRFCVHYDAALEAERMWMGANSDNELIETRRVA
ncbi:MAG: hypothetical protein L0229_20390 [Blastocatellia bacterium]|nr:hypothetical protein [Blastocatellia bacterium]